MRAGKPRDAPGEAAEEAERNVWDLAAKKINITRAKLER